MVHIKSPRLELGGHGYLRWLREWSLVEEKGLFTSDRVVAPNT